MATPPLLLLLLFLLILRAEAQQSYVNNKQLDCNQNYSNTLGFLCNAPVASCRSFLTFRSDSIYNSPATIAYLLNADALQIAGANNISDVSIFPPDTLVIVPVNCSCARNYYQHNASYTLKQLGETYFSVANNTYQALSTCQAMIAQNPYDIRGLTPDLTLNVPLLCACPTPNQTAAGFNYLLTYLIRQGNTYNSIAAYFAGAGADVPSILDANELSIDDQIFFFTPLLVPLKTEPTKLNIAVTPPPPPPPPNFSPPPPAQSSRSGSRKGIYIGVGVGVAVLILFLSSALAIWFFRYRRPRTHESPSPPPPLKLADESGFRAAKTQSSRSISSEGIRNAIETLTLYKFEELEKATESFAESNRIDGTSVYCASFKGDNAVVKMMKGDVTREIDALRQLNHSRIVRLSGYCLHDGLTYLVYEYAENGSLLRWLRPELKDNRLDWKQRIQVAYDIADALNYLHNFTHPPYIHKNLTTTNVLLDTNMRAKITNFGLARALDTGDEAAVTRHVVGTHGYMSPEFIESGLVTPKLDVYALGVIILELLSGREPATYTGKDGGGWQFALTESIREVLVGENVRGKLKEFMDPWLGEEYPLELAYSAAQLACNCVALDLNGRPLVSEVFLALSKLLLASLEWDPSHDTSLTLSGEI